MFPFPNQFLVNLVISFLLRQFKKFGNSIDWVKIETDLVTRLTDLLPSWLDADGIALVKAICAGGKAVMGNTDAVDNILRLVAQEKWAEAINALKALLLGAWIPTDVVGLKAKAALAA